MTEVTPMPDAWKPEGAWTSQPRLWGTPTTVDGLAGEEVVLLQELGDVWMRHQERNRRLTEYYEAKQPLRDFGTTVPEQIKAHYVPVGWARKAVDMLAELCVFDGFVAPGTDDPFGLNARLSRAGFSGVLQQAVQTALIHGCSFLAVLRDADGQPVVRTHTAESAAAIWDYTRRQVKACMAVTDMDEHRNATGLVLYLPTRSVSLSLAGGKWTVTGSAPTSGDGCDVFRIAYKPTEVKPFGRSRISRDAMRIIDAADRTIVRAEANAEFYAFPKIFMLGTSPELADMNPDEALRLYMGRMNVVSRDVDGDSPTVTQLAAGSMDPHLSMLKAWASMFASAMNIPASSLGVVADSNPTSADATNAQREDLIIEAQHCDRDFGQSLLQVARRIVKATQPGVADSDLDGLQADWRNPNTPSASMNADAFSKLAAAIPGFSTSDVGWARAGLSRGEIIRLRATQTETQADSALAQLIAADGIRTSGESETTGTTEATQDADEEAGGPAGDSPEQGGGARGQRA